MSEPSLSVVIPTLGTGGALPRVVQGLRSQSVGASRQGAFELVLALDSSAGEPEEAAAEATVAAAPFPARLVRGDRPGASANRNAGARAARAAIVLLCDDDTIPLPEMLAEHLAWHEYHPQAEVSVLGMVRWSPEVRVSAFMKWLDRGIQFDYPLIRGIEAGWGRFFTANVSLKREFAIETVGGFDETRFPFGYEDLDFGLRADREGMRLLFNRAAVSEHLREMTPEMWLRRIRRLAVAERRFTDAHPEIEPFFHRMLAHAATQPPARGWGRHLAGHVSPAVPWLGPKVWTSADLYFKQLLAPAFLEAWEEAAGGSDNAAPDLRERAG